MMPILTLLTAPAFRLITLAFTLLVVATACEDAVTITIENHTPQLVVEGWLTDQPGVHEVKLSSTLPYNQADTPPPVTGASVTLLGNDGTLLAYTEAAPGQYLTPANFHGTVGTTYTLAVTLANGTAYTSLPETLLPVVPIDSIYTVVDDDVAEGEEAALYVAIDFTDPEGEDNYYRWKVYINGEFQDGADGIYAGSIEDEGDGEVIEEFTFAEFPLQPGDVVVVEQLSLTEAAQQFFFEVETQTKATGGPFDAPEAPIIGNIRLANNPQQYALGYFGVSAYTARTTVITEN